MLNNKQAEADKQSELLSLQSSKVDADSTALRDELASAKSEVASLKQTLLDEEQLRKSKICKLEMDLHDQRESTETAEQQITSLESDLKSARRDLDYKKQIVQELVSEKQNLECEFRSQIALQSEFEMKYRELASEYGRALGELKSVTAVVNSISDGKTGLEQIISDLTSESELCKRKLENMTRNEKEYLSVIETLKQVLTSAHSSAGQLETDIKAVKELYVTKEQEYSQLIMEHEQEKSKLHAMTQEMERLNALLPTMQAEKAEALNELSSLRVDFEELQRRFEFASDELHSKVKELSDAREKIANYADESLEYEKQAIDTKNTIQTLKQDAIKRQKEIEYFESHQNDNENVIIDLNRQLAERTLTIDSLESSVRDLEKLKETQKLLDNTILEKDKAIDDLNSKCDSMRSEIMIYKMKVTELKTCNEQIQQRSKDEMDVLKNECQHLKQNVDSLTERGSRITQEKEAMQDAYTKLKMKYESEKLSNDSQVPIDNIKEMKEKLEEYEETIANLSDRIHFLDNLQDEILMLRDERDRLKKKLERLENEPDLNPRQPSSNLKRKDEPRSPIAADRKKTCAVRHPATSKSVLITSVNNENDEDMENVSPQQIKSLISEVQEQKPPKFPHSSPADRLNKKAHPTTALNTSNARRVSFISNPKARTELGPTERVTGDNSECAQQ